MNKAIRPRALSRLFRSSKHRRVIVPIALLMTAVMAAPGCVASPANEIREDVFDVNGRPTLNVENIDGLVQIEGSADSVIRVRATLRDSEGIRYSAVQNGDLVTVTVVRIAPWWFFGRAAADVEVSVPEGTALNLRTSNGGISATDVTGGGVLKTSNGSISVRNVKGDFEGTTSNGRIEVNGMDGDGLFRTSNGRIDLVGAVGAFNASTSNGRISFSGEMRPGGQNRLSTSNGQVDVKLQGTPSIDIDASTSNGRITSGLPILATKTGSTSLAGTIGAGEAKLVIRTSNGSVTIE